MGWRIVHARLLLKFASFFQTLPVVVMKPDDLIEFSRQTYSRPQNIQAWAEEDFVDSGLTAQELNLLQQIPIKSGRLLILGVGGGREAIPLAQLGYQVEGIDFIEELANRAKKNAGKRGVTINCSCQELSRLQIPENSYDFIWLSRAMYSSVPTRERRVAMLRKIKAALKPGGYYLCQFHLDPRVIPSRKGYLLRKVIAAVTFGNLQYEPGDTLWLNVEFVHSFPSEAAVRSELEAGGFLDIKFVTDSNQYFHAAICRKRELQ